MGSTAQYRTTSPEAAIEMFWSRVDQTSVCWRWTGWVNHKGYGVMQSKWLPEILVHRIAYANVNGPIPEGMMVLHRCDNPPCVRPDHLFLGTNADNMQDMLSKGRSIRVGSRNPGAKLTEADVPLIRAAARRGESFASIARRFGVSANPIREIVTGQAWTHVPQEAA